jgi:NitT/TauT family transport system substrate-binding protein
MRKIIIGVISAIALTVLLVVLQSCGSSKKEALAIRVGYFPNITHAQAIIGMANGTFQKALGEEVKIVPRVFNAGPSVIEAMFAGEIDLAYIGPNPTVNGYVKSKGEVLRIVAGATSGGSALVIRTDAGINTIADFHGKKIASPQLGNTQDVALRGWLKDNGLVLKDKGGDVEVLPISNPDQLTLFLKKEIDGAWTVEPWVSRLVKEGKGKVYLDERTIWPDGQYVTAHLIVSKKFLDTHRDLVKKWIVNHVELTGWINENQPEAKKILNQELKRITGKSLPDDIINDAFGRLKITYDPIKSSLFTSVRWAFEQGFLGSNSPDISGIYDLSVLNEVLKEKGLNPIQD